MRLWTTRRRQAPNAAPPPERVSAPSLSDSADPAVIEAYARGRRDERARRRRSPGLAIALVLTAMVGGWTLASAALRGSFEDGGRLIDKQLVTAAREAGPALGDAARGAARLTRGDTPNATAAN